MTDSTSTIQHRNEVSLIGRVSNDPEVTLLPSGDAVVTFRLVVQRPPVRTMRAGAQKVDTLMCTAWNVRVQHVISEWSAGDVVAVDGALRRRFWRAATGPASRYEVELVDGRRLAMGATVTDAAGSAPSSAGA